MRTTPFFKEATPREVRSMRSGSAANIAVILFCASWLVFYFPVVGLQPAVR